VVKEENIPADFSLRFDRIKKELKELKKYLKKQKPPKGLPADVKIKRYHALLEKISHLEKVGMTPDEVIAALHKKEYYMDITLDSNVLVKRC